MALDYFMDMMDSNQMMYYWKDGSAVYIGIVKEVTQ